MNKIISVSFILEGPPTSQLPKLPISILSAGPQYFRPFLSPNAKSGKGQAQPSHSHALEQAHLCPHHQGQLCCAVQKGCRSNPPEFCSR